MTTTDTPIAFNVFEELRSFRSRLFRIDLDTPTSCDELKGILDEYHDHHFEAFFEEYLIAGFNVTFVSTSRGEMKVL